MYLLRRRIATAGAGLAAVAVTLLATAPGASAALPTYRVTTDRVQAAAGWLATQFVDGTHLPAPGGDHFDSQFGGIVYPSYGENADVIFGLAAAKSGRAKIDAALSYLAENVNAYADLSGAQKFGPADGSVAKLALAAIVARRDPTHFGGHDLVAVLAADECPAASTTCTPGSAANIFFSGSESFVILAEARAGGGSHPSGAALAYLASLQCANGGFTKETTACGSGDADIDATSYAIMALTAAGGSAAQISKAVTWLKSQQAVGGYWISQGHPNPNSTGLAAAALRSQGASVTTARSWLRSQQIGAGSPGAGAVKYAGSLTPTTTSATSPSVLATAQTLNGLVDGASLATVTASGATDDIAMFAPAATLSPATVLAGRKQTATGSGFVAGENVSATIHSKTVTVGTAKADPLGSVKISYTVPTSIGAGAHTVTLTGMTSGLSAERRLTVTTAAAVSTSPGSSASGAPTTNAVAGDTSIAATGRDGRRLLGVSALGLLAVLTGVALVGLGRRRSH